MSSPWGSGDATAARHRCAPVAASRAYSPPSGDAAYTTPFATAAAPSEPSLRFRLPSQSARVFASNGNVQRIAPVATSADTSDAVTAVVTKTRSPAITGWAVVAFPTSTAQRSASRPPAAAESDADTCEDPAQSRRKMGQSSAGMGSTGGAVDGGLEPDREPHPARAATSASAPERARRIESRYRRP